MYFFSLIFVIYSTLFGATPAVTDNLVTNPYAWDGIGSQFQKIIYSVIYAEFTEEKFIYTPFNDVEPNYDRDSTFIQKKENLINFIGHFEINRDLRRQKQMHSWDFISYAAGILSNGLVYYTPFWHPPLPTWIKLDAI